MTRAAASPDTLLNVARDDATVDSLRSASTETFASVLEAVVPRDIAALLDGSAAPMLVEPRPAEDHRLQPMSDELDGDGAPATEDGVLLLPRGLFDALDDDDVPPAPSDPTTTD